MSGPVVRGDDPRLCVLICAWDPDPGFLRAAVASALQQDLSDLAVLVVEDPGGRPAADALAGVADPRLRLCRNDRRLGLVASRNRGLELARSELVAILDADDECLPGRFSRQVEFLAAHPEVAVVGGQVQVVDEQGRLLGYRSYPTGHEAIVRVMRRSNPLAHPAVMLRRAAVLAAGGYREFGQGACDDYELWSRLARAGARFANLPDLLVRYRLHGGAMKARLLRATLLDSLRVKGTYWADQSDLGDRLRRWGERALLLLPPKLVAALFRRLVLRQTLRRAAGP